MALVHSFSTMVYEESSNSSSGSFPFPSFYIHDWPDNISILTITRTFLFAGAMYQNPYMVESPKRSSTQRPRPQRS